MESAQAPCSQIVQDLREAQTYHAPKEPEPKCGDSWLNSPFHVMCTNLAAESAEGGDALFE